MRALHEFSDLWKLKASPSSSSKRQFPPRFGGLAVFFFFFENSDQGPFLLIRFETVS